MCTVSGLSSRTTRPCVRPHGSLLSYGLFTLPDPDSDPFSDSDSCTMQKFHIGSDPDSDPLIEMYGIGTDICSQDRYLSLKWVQ